jgi:hypothetical protein
VYVPVPEVVYPVPATIVHDAPAAKVSLPIMQSPSLSFHPRAGIEQAVEPQQVASSHVTAVAHDIPLPKFVPELQV